MLTQDQVDYLVKKLNKKVDIPVVGERFEAQLIEMGIWKIDKELDDHLPNQWKDLLNNVGEGLEPGSPADLEVIKSSLVKFLNNKINIPIIGERAEKKLLEKTIDLLVEALKKGKKLKEN